VGRTGNVALAALAALEVAAAGYVVAHNTAPKRPAAPVAAQQQNTPRTSPSHRPSLGIAGTSAALGRPARVVVAFLGDDWTAGTGASGHGKRFSTLLAERLGLRERNFGVALTGYAKASATGGAYGSRIDAVVAARPRLVVVSGGRNDRSDSAETVAADADQLFAALHSRLPHAVLVAVAPFWGDSDLPPELKTLSGAVEKAVTGAGGRYLDVADPIHGHPDFMADAGDPNDRGYAAIAAALAPKLAALLPR
jgi:lysophospholipase L1-like esterase